MERRAFLESLAGVIAGTTFDLEQALWVPGAKTIFLPPAPIIATVAYWLHGKCTNGKLEFRYEEFREADCRKSKSGNLILPPIAIQSVQHNGLTIYGRALTDNEIGVLGESPGWVLDDCLLIYFG